MEQFLQFIFVLALAKYCVNAALTRRASVMALYAAVPAAVAFAIWPLVVETRGDVIASLLADTSLVADGALLITLEAVAGIFITIFVLDNYFMPKERRKRSIFVLKVLPGVVCFFAVAYFELLFFKASAGREFVTTALMYSALIFGVIMGFSLLLGYLMPGESTKLEAKILLDMVILFIGLFVNASIASYSVSSSHIELEFAPMLILLAMISVLAICGMVLFKTKHKINNRIKKILNKTSK